MKKSDKDTITIITSEGTIILDCMQVQYFTREGNTTEFVKADNSKVMALLPFEHYEEQVAGCNYMFKANDDTVVNYFFIASVKDENGNEIHNNKRNDKPN